MSLSVFSTERDCRVKAEEASVKFFLRKLSPFPLGSTTEPELVLRKPGSGLKITGYKGWGLRGSGPHTPAAAPGPFIWAFLNGPHVQPRLMWLSPSPLYADPSQLVTVTMQLCGHEEAPRPFVGVEINRLFRWPAASQHRVCGKHVGINSGKLTSCVRVCVCVFEDAKTKPWGDESLMVFASGGGRYFSWWFIILHTTFQEKEDALSKYKSATTSGIQAAEIVLKNLFGWQVHNISNETQDIEKC